MKLPSYKSFNLNVYREGIYLIWVRLKSRKAELKHRVKVSLAKYVGMFRRGCSYNIRFIFTIAKPHIFLIPKNQNILETPSRCSNLKFFLEGLSTLNCF